jgi:hypothetical protein
MCNRECPVKVDDYNNRICCNWGTEIAWNGIEWETQYHRVVLNNN